MNDLRALYGILSRWHNELPVHVPSQPRGHQQDCENSDLAHAMTSPTIVSSSLSVDDAGFDHHRVVATMNLNRERTRSIHATLQAQYSAKFAQIRRLNLSSMGTTLCGHGYQYQTRHAQKSTTTSQEALKVQLPGWNHAQICEQVS